MYSHFVIEAIYIKFHENVSNYIFILLAGKDNVKRGMCHFVNMNINFIQYPARSVIYISICSLYLASWP